MKLTIGPQQFGVETDPEGQVTGLIAHTAGDGIDRLFDDQLRGTGRHLFDLHAARGAHHDHRPSYAAIRDDAQVELLGDVLGLLHQDLVDHLAFGAGLVGDQGHAQDLVRHPLHLLGGRGGLDAAALAAAAGMDLGLDHKGACPQFLGHLPGLPVGVGHRAFGHRYVEFPQQFFGLIFMNLHNRRSFQKRRLPKIKPEEQEKQRKIESLKKIREFMTIITGSFLQSAPGF